MKLTRENFGSTRAHCFAHTNVILARARAHVTHTLPRETFAEFRLGTHATARDENKRKRRPTVSTVPGRSVVLLKINILSILGSTV